MGDGMASTDEQPPPSKGWEWRRAAARVDGDTSDGWLRRGVKTWLVTGPCHHRPRFQQSWEGATWCAPATEDLQPMEWPEYPTYDIVTRESFYGHMATGGTWEYWYNVRGLDGRWESQSVWSGPHDCVKKRALDENGKPCLPRSVKRID